MQPLVQSAIDAARCGENNKAVEFIKQALAANPDDVDAWLVLAAVVEQPERKRQCLNRVLSLDPINEIARDELLEMDRAAMGGTSVPFFQEPAPPPPSYPASTSAFEPEPDPLSRLSYSSESSPTHTSAFEAAPVPPQPQEHAAPRPGPRTRIQKPQVFKYSTLTRIMVYVGTVFFGFLTLIGLVQPEALCVPCAFFLIMLPAIWIVSAEVELSEKGIRTSRLFGLTSAQVSWNEIASLKSGASSLDLISKKGNRVKVTSQISEYPVVVETLRQRRPDLFGLAAASPVQANVYAPDKSEQAPASSSGSSVPAASVPAFSGARTFRKSFFKQYIITFVAFFFCLFFAWLGLSELETRAAFFTIAGACVLFMIFPLFQVNAIKVEPNKLTIETLFEQKVFGARQIKEIKMQVIHGRYGRVMNILNIVPEQGKNYPLQGFSAGDEFIYGFLMNWWNAYRNRSLE